MTPHQTKLLMIQRANKKFNTKGERQFDEYQQSRVMGLYHGARGEGLNLSFYDEVVVKYFEFQCDFLRPRYPGLAFSTSYLGSYDVDFEVDGKGHKEKWDEWKDALKAKAGLKVIHIPEAVTKEAHWPYLDKQIQKALDSKEMVHHVPE